MRTVNAFPPRRLRRQLSRWLLRGLVVGAALLGLAAYASDDLVLLDAGEPAAGCAAWADAIHPTLNKLLALTP